MFNKSYDHGTDNNNSQTVNVYNSYAPAAQSASAITSVSMFGIMAVLLLGIAMLIERLISGFISGLFGTIAALIVMLGTIFPWLISGAVAVALGFIALRSLPEAIAEVGDIRYRRSLAASNARLLGVKDVDGVILDVRATTIEHTTKL